MGIRFTDQLRKEHEEVWDAAVHHRFVEELIAGSVADNVMAGYLIQDYRFLDSFLALLGEAVVTADNLRSRLVFARYIGEVAGDENTYFVDSMRELGVEDSRSTSIEDTPATRGFKQLFFDAARSGSYAAVLAVLNVTEWLYLSWASSAQGARPPRRVHAEWIDLHDYAGFHEFVAFLREELDRVGENEVEVSREYFARAIRLERMFFDNAYEFPINER